MKLQTILIINCVASLFACGGGSSGTTPTTITPPPSPPPVISAEPVIAFTDITAQSGLSRSWGITSTRVSFTAEFASGIAAADYDEDGDIDLYVVGGDIDRNHLYQNQSDGNFIEIAASLGLDMLHRGSGPNFSDFDGDGDLDLFTGAIEGDPYYLMENHEGEFFDITVSTGLAITVSDSISSTFSDYDQDGDLDLFLSHWGAPKQADTETIWRNNGDGTFTSASIESGIAEVLIEPTKSTGKEIDRTFTPNLSDIDADGDSDLLMAADFNTSQVFINNGDGTFTRTTDREVIIDQAGMGSAVGDYDNDGDMDWFVTSITEDDDFFGNRLYRNDGTGVFEDATEEAGVARGGWAWGSCFADFDNDGYLDLFHVNGWRGGTGSGNDGPNTEFKTDQIRFFHNQGDNTFRQIATSIGLTDTGQGRGVACFDSERDGDIDIVLTNNDENQLVYYRNDSTNENHYLGIMLEDDSLNTKGIGARISITTSMGTQVREVRAGNNYVSQDPPEVHIGLGAATSADIVVNWPDGSQTSSPAVEADQLLTIKHE